MGTFCSNLQQGCAISSIEGTLEASWPAPEALAGLTDKKPQSLMRMLSPSGNPSLGNIARVVALLRQHESVELHVQAR